jgi:oxygen-independent coproporphyrinogen-3 oxidase
VERDWGLELDAALALGIPHLSLYGLSVEKETPLARAIEQGEVSLPDEEDYREQFITASERLTAEGYRHYEVSNFARPGFEARHNRVYWELLPYLGLGNSAHSFRAPRRRWNLRNWNAYQEANRDGALPWDSEEELTAEDARLERIWLGLRNDRGIRTYDLEPEARGLVEGWVAKGQAIVAGGVVRLTPEGWLLLDHLVVELDLALGEVSY